MGPLNPWSPGFQEAVRIALAVGGRLTSLAREVVEHPAASWWTAPLDRTRQVLVTDDLRESSRQPERDASGWEDYAQRPAEWRLTSTLYGTCSYSCVDVVIARGIGDWPRSSEQRRFMAEIDESARVLEISTPAEWHGLCASFPRIDRSRDSPAGAGMIVPGWDRVAERWDGIHLTFAGLLTVPLVRHSTAAGATMMWNWNTEGTMWLPGAVLRSTTPLPAIYRHDLEKFPSPLME